MPQYRGGVPAKLRFAVGGVELDFETDATLSLTDIRAILDDVAKIARSLLGTTTAPALSGTVTTVFGGRPIAGAAVSSIGLVPEFSTRSAPTGLFAVDAVGIGQEFFVRCDGLPGFLASTCGPFRSDSLTGTIRVESAAAPDVARQYASVGLAQQPRASTLVLELQQADGRPLEGVPVSDITLTTDSGTSAGVGPFLIGPAGDAVPPQQLPSTVAVDGRARAVFLNCREGKQVVAVASPQGPVSTTVRLAEGELTITSLRR